MVINSLCRSFGNRIHHHVLYWTIFQRMASLVTCVLAMYLALVVDKTIMGCCLLLQAMAPPPIMNTNHVVDFLSLRSLAQSASQYLTKSRGGNPPKCNLNYKVPYKYWKMRLTIIQCSRLGLAMCWFTTLIGYAKCNQVQNCWKQ